LGEGWQRLSDLWRLKQLQYTWVRGLAQHHADFWQVTGDALDFALAISQIARPGLHEHLMQFYLQLSSYPEVPAMLSELRHRRMKLAILSNGPPIILEAVVKNSGLQGVSIRCFLWKKSTSSSRILRCMASSQRV
jgi:2-haloacid dehalogenase